MERWKSAYITEAVQKGLSNLSALIGPFSDIDPIINFDTVEPNVEAVIDKTADELEMLGVETVNDDDTDDDDEEQTYQIHSNVFHVFDNDFVDETGKI